MAYWSVNVVIRFELLFIHHVLLVTQFLYSSIINLREILPHKF